MNRDKKTSYGLYPPVTVCNGVGFDLSWRRIINDLATAIVRVFYGLSDKPAKIRISANIGSTATAESMRSSTPP